MRLSACLVTRDSGGWLPEWMARVRTWADEVVIGVDAASSDDTYAVARAGADVAELVELRGIVEPALDWIARRASGDWIVRLDDDELLPHDAAEHLPALLADRRFTHYRFPVRWVVERPDGAQAWLRGAPWAGDSSSWVTLWRNLGGTWRIPNVLHTIPEIHGDGRTLPMDGPLCLYHLDLLWRDRASREAKAARYRAAAPAGRGGEEEYYLVEDYASSLELAPLPPGERPFPRRRPAGRPAASPPGAPVTSYETLVAHAAAVGDDPPLWGAEFLGHTVPDELPAARGTLVEVAVRNTSAASWGTSGARVGRVVLGYRWSSAGWGTEVEVADTAPLPAPLAPGQAATLRLGLWAPREPGDYVVALDMLCEEVAWFSARGVAPLELPVRVRDDGPRPRAEHFVPRIPAPPPLEDREARAGRMVAVPPVRILDTRAPGGVPGARAGRVEQDGLVVLSAAGHAGVPPDATAILATAAVLDADYAGFLTVFPTDGTTGGAFPSLHFSPGGAHDSLVVAALGAGRGAGRVSLHLSPGPEGASAHLLLDLTGYVAP